MSVTVSSSRSQVSLKDITDGAHCTYFGGEKYMNPDFYHTDIPSGWLYQGLSPAVNRAAANSYYAVPMQDTPGLDQRTSYRFGSAHWSGFHMLMCDGSVHQINYSVDREVHHNLGSRKDCQVIPKLPW